MTLDTLARAPGLSVGLGRVVALQGGRGLPPPPSRGRPKKSPGLVEADPTHDKTAQLDVFGREVEWVRKADRTSAHMREGPSPMLEAVGTRAYHEVHSFA